MNRTPPDTSAEFAALERRSRELLDASAEALDGHTRSRLNRARQAALAEAVTARGVRPFRVPGAWLPGGVLAAAAVLTVAVWVARPVTLPVAELNPVEDLELLASREGPERYAEEGEFYEWAGNDPAGSVGGAG